jgi:hypothetical protein
MKVFWLTFLAFLATIFSSFAEEFNMKELRETLRTASDTKANSTKLFEKVGGYSGEDAVLISYKAAAHAIKAKFATNPLKKLKFIKASARIFEEAVQRNNKDLEIRFVRYAVETQTPAKIKLSKHVEEDKNMLMQAIRDYPKSGFHPDVARLARDFLKQNCSCSEEEKKELEAFKLN